MITYMAKPVSRAEIRYIVRELKKKLGMEYELRFPILEFLEHVLPMVMPDFQYEIVAVKEMGNKHGETYPSKKLIRIREDIYERAIQGEGRDRLTIAHEIGHLFLHKDDSISLCRVEPGSEVPNFLNPEWQANAFAGELLASSYLIKNMTPTEISHKCNISYTAACVQKQYVA